MQIGILTFHNVYNPGAFFQALGTQELLRFLGYNPCIIDYTSPEHRFNPIRRLLRYPHAVLKNPRDWWESIKRNTAFQQCQSNLRKSKCIKNHSDLNKIYFDSVLIGSDIVWNYQWRKLGRDPVYFSKYLNTDRCIAYAPSCGNIDFNRKIPDYVQSGLKNFYRISVRDEKTAQLVERVLGHRPIILRDPSFSLDLNLMNIPIEEDNNIAVVYAPESLLKEEFIDDIRNFCKKKKIKTVALCYRQSWTDLNLIDLNPFQWIGKINSAKYVFTSTFHGTVFGIKTKSNFVVQLNQSIASKVIPTLDLLDLKCRIWNKSGDIENIFREEWDYETVFDRIVRENQKAQSFLKDALE